MNARKLFLLLVVVAALALAIVPALAAETRVKTLTEDEINNSYRVTNPARRSVSNVSVDLQPGQVVVYSTHTYPRGRVYQVMSTFTASVSNGRIVWQAVTASVDGQTVPQEVLNQINAWIDASWRNYFKSKHSGRVVSVEISEDAITITYTVGRG